MRLRILGLCQKPKGLPSDDQTMWFNDMTLVLLLVGGGVMAGWIVLRGIGASSCGLAQAIIEHRRHEEHVQLQAIAAAEAAGRAASLEPLALNADGTIAAPVLGLVENR